MPFVELLPRVTPRERPVLARAKVLGPPANEHDSHLGGWASGLKFKYEDAMEFVWWAPDALPAPDVSAYGGGLYGAREYGGEP